MVHSDQRRYYFMKTFESLVYFFLRQTADIDHVSPIIWQLAQADCCKIKIMLYHDFSPHQVLYQKMTLAEDFRLEYLSKFPGVEIFHFTTLCRSKLVDGMPLLEAAGILTESLFNQARLEYRTVTVAFDWHFDDLPSVILKNAKRMGIRTCMLPHASGCLVERNHLIAEDDIGTKIKEAPYIHPHEYEKFLDFDVFPNMLTATEASPSFPPERLPILGSARYCERWVNHLSEICPGVSADDDADRLKIAVFPRSWRYPVNWPALGAALKLLAEMENISIIVQHHTRENDFLNNISDNYRDIQEIPGKLRIVDYNSYSGSLVRWADIVLSLCTSVSFEAVVLGKPVLELEYLHSLRSYLGENYPQTEILSHDDLLRAVTAIRHGSIEYQLTFNERVNFMRDMVHSGNDRVLERYQELLVPQPPANI